MQLQVTPDTSLNPQTEREEGEHSRPPGPGDEPPPPINRSADDGQEVEGLEEEIATTVSSSSGSPPLTTPATDLDEEGRTETSRDDLESRDESSQESDGDQVEGQGGEGGEISENTSPTPPPSPPDTPPPPPLEELPEAQHRRLSPAGKLRTLAEEGLRREAGQESRSGNSSLPRQDVAPQQAVDTPCQSRDAGEREELRGEQPGAP